MSDKLFERCPYFWVFLAEKDYPSKNASLWYYLIGKSIFPEAFSKKTSNGFTYRYQLDNNIWQKFIELSIMNTVGKLGELIGDEKASDITVQKFKDIVDNK